MNPTLAGLFALVSGPGTLVSLLIGTLAGIAAGLAPGVSGRSALLIALPFVLGLPPIAAAVLLIALHASSQISGTIPAALIGAPTSASEAATATDGYPIARRGEGGRVVGAILASTTLGGVSGALVLLLLAPFGAHIVLAFGTPEIAAFAAIGIIAIAAVSSSGLAIGIVVGAFGALVSTVGFDNMTGIPRFSFGNTDLLNGLSTPAIVAGIIAVPELLARIDRKAQPRAISASLKGTVAGLAEPFRHGWLALRSGIIGFVVGLLPGLGTSVAVWLAYGHAARTSNPSVPFGQGAIEGVVAPECANGAKEGGAYFPTLLLGVPGSSGLAIMLGAFAVIGIKVGPSMFSLTPQLPAAVGFTVLFADVLALVLCLVAAPIMIRLASLDRRIIVPISLTAATAAAYYASPFPVTSLEVLGFGCIGVVLSLTGISRPPFLIGFIVGPILESTARRSAMIYGWRALERPGVMMIIAIMALVLALLIFRRRAASRPRTGIKINPAASWPLAGMAAVFAAAIVVSSGYPSGASALPIAAGTAGLISASWAIFRLSRTSVVPTALARLDYRLALLLGAGLILCKWVGPVALTLPLLNLVMPRAVAPSLLKGKADVDV